MIEYDDEQHAPAGKHGGLRPFSDVRPHELARLERARGIKDLDKLARMLPASLRQPIPEAAWRGFYRRGSRAGDGMPVFTLTELEFKPGAPAKLPNLATRKAAPVRVFPNVDPDAGTQAYIAAFLEKNRLIP